MSFEANDEAWLKRCPPGSPELEYFATLLRVVRGAGLPSSRRSGIALLWFLHYEKWEVGSVDSDRHVMAGSLRDDAELVGHCFASVNPDVDFWIARFQETARAELDEGLLRAWREAFSTAPSCGNR